MAKLLLPVTPGVPFQRSRVTLDGREFILDLQWNEREERWYLSISDEEGAPILMGRKLVCEVPLLVYYLGDPRVPPGDLRVIDMTHDYSPPGLNDLGAGLRCELTYDSDT